MAGFPTKPKRSQFKNGTFMGGVGGSGTAKNVRKEEKAAKSYGYNSKGAQAARNASVGRTAPGTGAKLDDTRYLPGQVIGKALETIEDEGLRTIEVVVGRV